MEIFLVIIIAVLVDAYWGDEHFLWRKVPHPIIYVGRYIKFLDIEFNRKEFSDKSKFFNGFIVIFISVIGIYFLTGILEDLLFDNAYGNIILGFLVSTLLSGKSLFSHVKSIYDDLMRDDIESAKFNLSKIVSRDVDKLDESSITRGSIESLSENFCDGYISPIFWFLVSGLPGLVIYKFISTADSLIGYKNDKYIKFGKCAAKIDDIMNFIPARISSLFIILATYLLKENWKSAIQITKMDAKKK
jgi:adenosylcobinamide-phosphate synthase